MAPGNTTQQESVNMPKPNAATPAASGPNARMQNRNGPYQRAQVETASPARLIVLLYDGAIKFCKQALEAMDQHQLERQHKNLINAQRIVSELLGSLNRDLGGDATTNLVRLYTFMIEQLVYANLYDRKEHVEAVLPLLLELRETWQEVERVTRTASDGGVAGTAAGAAGITDAQAVREGQSRLQRLGDRSA